MHLVSEAILRGRPEKPIEMWRNFIHQVHLKLIALSDLADHHLRRASA